MPRAGVGHQRHRGHPGLAQPVDQEVDQRHLPVHRIALAHYDVDGQARVLIAQLAQVGQPPGPGEHRLARLRVEAEPAPRIGDVGVHDGLVPGQPVELGASGLERRVEPGQVDRLVQVQGLFHRVDHGRPGEHHRVDLVAVVEQELLRREGPHAVREQDQRLSRVVLVQPGRDRAEVGHQPGPAARAQLPQVRLRPRRGPVAALVHGHRRVTRLAQRLGQPGEPLGVVPHAVHDLHHRARVPGRVPAVGGQLQPVTALDREPFRCRRGHVSRPSSRSTR